MFHLILSILLAALFLLTGGGKVLGLAFSTRGRDALGVSPLFWRVTGLLEWAGAAGLIVGIWVSWVGIAAGIGLAVLMVGAIGVRIAAARRSGPLTQARGLDRAISADVLVLALAVIDVVLVVRGF
jgi:uncharacterized membrane protein YphA (DoxX/SURF4 family)